MKKKYNTYIVCNPGPYAETLKKALGSKFIIDSPEILARKKKNLTSVLILAELTWEHKKHAQFYGYDLALSLIEGEITADLAFFSFLDRQQLIHMTSTAGILCPIFPHHRLPMSETDYFKLNIPPISPVKWKFIRRYVLEKSGMIDKLVHDIRHLTEHSTSKDIRDMLTVFERYRSILSEEILDYIGEFFPKMLKDKHLVPIVVEDIVSMLALHKSSFPSETDAELEDSPYRMMIVEDRDDILDKLEEGFSNFFQVETFPGGEKAIEALAEDPSRYNVCIIDLELKDEQGFWQSVHGIDLLEAASKIPHLVTYILTSYSKRAVSTIKRLIQSELRRDIPVIYKTPDRIIPDYLSYADLAREFIEKIEDNIDALRGPKLGIWKSNGLLAIYHQISTPALWETVFQAVDSFIKSQDLNDRNARVIPTTFPQLKTKKFTEKHLRTLLMHRLICLYLQKKEGKIDFDNGLRRMSGFNGDIRGNLSQYFNSYLGLSKSLDEKEEGIVYVEEKGLFEEEIQWLDNKFPDLKQWQYPELVEFILEPLKMDLSESFWEKYGKGFPNDIRSLKSLFKAVKVLEKMFRTFLPTLNQGKNTTKCQDSEILQENIEVIEEFFVELKKYMGYEESDKLREDAPETYQILNKMLTSYYNVDCQK